MTFPRRLRSAFQLRPFLFSALFLLAPPAARAVNPIIPEGRFLSDPAPRVGPDGRLWVFGSRDVRRGDWCSKFNDVLETRDMRTFRLHENILDAGRTLYAPDAIFLDGLWRLFYCTPERDWYTLEGPFWFRDGEWQYVIYSGGCYQDDTYHLGYAAAHSAEEDLTKVDFVKHTKDGRFDPLLIRNEVEEGTGHNSVIRWKGEWYAVYHGRDGREKRAGAEADYVEERTGRLARLIVQDGTIRAERL